MKAIRQIGLTKMDSTQKQPESLAINVKLKAQDKLTVQETTCLIFL